MGSRAPGVPVRRVTISTARADLRAWPWTIPAVAHVVEHGLDLSPGVTVLLGPNGAGKSTLVEALAAAWGRRMWSVRSDWLQQSAAQPSEEDSDLYREVFLHTTTGGATGGLFLRAERLHSQAKGFTKRGRWSERVGETPLLELSHGEGFLAILHGMTAETGFYVLDEPESALSFGSSLVLLQILRDMAAAGSQVVLATHSPVLAAVPGARLLQLDDRGITEVDYDDADLVTGWRAFLQSPERFLRHLD